ncbi:MAG: hypothetical protein K8S25_17815 [Alphaproteobacteria bacterium]|nr:hypothetical protein [Alphaproteobacteria bacterium]
MRTPTKESELGKVADITLMALDVTKWGLEGWSESLAYELAPLDIRVKTVAPGGGDRGVSQRDTRAVFGVRLGHLRRRPMMIFFAA